MEREKKARADLDKAKRKLEADLKTTQGSVEELERIKKELEDNLKKKDQENHNLSSKIEDATTQNNGLNKKIKDVQVSLKKRFLFRSKKRN